MEKRVAALEKRIAALEKTMKNNMNMNMNANANAKKNKTVKNKKKKQPNEFIKMVMKAKKNDEKQFEYNGKTYYAHKHAQFGTVYKQAKP